jgi:hypothetical protein
VESVPDAVQTGSFPGRHFLDPESGLKLALDYFRKAVGAGQAQ